MVTKTEVCGITIPHCNIPESLGLHWNLDEIRKLCSTSWQPSSSLANQDHEILRRVKKKERKKEREK
jgi:hypothetical protein